MCVKISSFHIIQFLSVLEYIDYYTNMETQLYKRSYMCLQFQQLIYFLNCLKSITFLKGKIRKKVKHNTFFCYMKWYYVEILIFIFK